MQVGFYSEAKTAREIAKRALHALVGLAEESLERLTDGLLVSLSWRIPPTPPVLICQANSAPSVTFRRGFPFECEGIVIQQKTVR